MSSDRHAENQKAYLTSQNFKRTRELVMFQMVTDNALVVAHEHCEVEHVLDVAVAGYQVVNHRPLGVNALL